MLQEDARRRTAAVSERMRAARPRGTARDVTGQAQAQTEERRLADAAADAKAERKANSDDVATR